jgi:hypothetical protein
MIWGGGGKPRGCAVHYNRAALSGANIIILFKAKYILLTRKGSGTRQTELKGKEEIIPHA